MCRKVIEDSKKIDRSVLRHAMMLVVMLMCVGVNTAWATNYYYFIVNKSGKIVTYARTTDQTSSTAANGDAIPAAIKSVNGTNWKLYNGDQISSSLSIVDPLTTKPGSSYIIDCSSWGDVTLVGSPSQMSTLADCESSTNYPNYIFVFCDYLENSVPDLKNGMFYTMKYRGNSANSYAYYDETTQRVKNTGTSSISNPENNSEYLWCFKAAVVNGEIDPYDVKIYNASAGTGMADHFVANPLDPKGDGVGSGPENENNKLQPASVLTSNRIASYYVATSYYSGQYNITANPAYNQDDKTQLFYNLWAEYNSDSDTRSGITSQGRFMRGSNQRRQYSSIILTKVSKTYIIVDAAGNTIAQALTLSNTLDVPDVIKSPFASYTYYSTQADAIAETNPINSVTSTTIYVRYTTSSGDLDLNGGTDNFICTNGNYLYAASSNTIGIESSLSDPSSNTRKWKILGNDAYQLTIQNVNNSQYITYNVSSGEAVPTLSGTGSKFFLHQSNTGQYEVVAVTSGYYSTNYYSMGVANNTLKLYSSSNYAMGDDELQSDIYSQPTCATPDISFDNATSQVTITCATAGATIHYTTNGDTPTESSPSTPNPFTINTATTVKAIATHAGYLTSEVTTLAIAQVATPTIQNNGSNAVSITSATNGATIYYTTDGSTPTTSSTEYTEPLTEGASGVTIKAFAVKEDMINSAMGSGSVTLLCAAPVIVRNGNTGFTITCSFPTSGVTIYYTTDGSNPTTSSTSTTSGSTVTATLPITVKAMAVATNYDNSTVATVTVTQGMGGDGTAANPYTIEYQSDVDDFINKANTADEASKHYKIIATEPLDFSSAGSITQAFSGTLEGQAKADGTFPVISNLSHPLFNTVNGGTVKNIMLDNVQISQSGNVGAIASVASGYSRIYNCGILPSTNGSAIESTTTSGDDTGYCGGLVGWLKDDSRVINCFSYADINGGNDVAGIVGHNEIASTAAVTDGKYADLRTAVVNCIFYGNITGGSHRYPVYGGEKIVNNTATGINNYDFYRAEASVGTLADYNCSWPAKEEYLTRYEFYRNLLNSNRELCGWWVGATSAPSAMTTTDVQNVAKDASLMAKWVLDTEIAPYPILKKFDKYASTVNIDADASWRTTANEWEGKKLGTLKVTINPGTHAAGGASTKSDVDFTITDMDTLRGDYCYKKIQLPYYNSVFGNPNGATWAAKYGGNYDDYVVVGWKVSTSEGTEGELIENWETGYNFADRNCTAKDADRVFAQGGYYYVPNGVENITITAQWASAVYLDNTDHYYDRVSVSSFTVSGGVSIGSSTLQPFAPAGTRSALGNGKTVNNGTISSNMPSGSVYGNAIVLVGNHQEFAGASNIGSNNSGCTIMSADFDFDNEPDNCLIWQLGQNVNRQSFYPIRFDFLPVVEMGLAMKEDGSTQLYSLGCFRPLGHFEVTETALIHFGQFEFSNTTRTTYAPLILNGGIFDQYTKGTRNNAKTVADDRIDYIIIGGNVRIPSFTPGAHVNANANYPTRHCAINVIGGIIDNLYLTGNYNDNVTPNTDNPHCYIDGGILKQVAAAGKEGINGDVYFKINHSKIWEFYGGSTMDQSSGDNFKIVKGNINVTIDNSIVTKYCGGPKFGDMIYDEDTPANSKTITTIANNTIFGVYYGGGNGGTSYVQYDKSDGEQTVSSTFNWESTGRLNQYTAGSYRNEATGYKADYDMEIVNLSTGTNQNRAVYRTYMFAAQFSATNTGPITNHLTDCTVLTNFYGGGNLGGVKGDVTSTLDGTTHVYGSAFGAGFSASVPEVTIHAKDKTPPTIDVNTGIITPESGGTSTTYTWTHETSLGGQELSTTNRTVTVGGKNYFYTEKSLDDLGSVSGTVTLTIKDDCKIGTDGDPTTGNVYGGGDASAVINTTTPENASTTVNLQGNAEVLGNVFGGGNEGVVSGSATVNIEQ